MPSEESSPLSPEWAAAYGRASRALSGLNERNRDAHGDIMLKAWNTKDASVIKAPPHAAKIYQSFNVEILGGLDKAAKRVASMATLDEKDVPGPIREYMKSAKEKLQALGVNLDKPQDVERAIKEHLTDGKVGPITRAMSQIAEKVGMRPDEGGKPVAASGENPGAYEGWGREATPAGVDQYRTTIYEIADHHAHARAQGVPNLTGPKSGPGAGSAYRHRPDA
jgi:hypothetical protein